MFATQRARENGNKKRMDFFFSLFICVMMMIMIVCVCMLGLKSKNRKGIYAARLFFPCFPLFFPFEIGERQEISFVENVAICLCVVIGNLVSFAIRFLFWNSFVSPIVASSS